MSRPGLPLAGRRALVAGASTGIGAAIGRHLLEAGAEVHGLARRGELVEQSLGAEAVSAGRAHAHSVDLTDREALDSLLDRLLVQPFDILVVAAGTNVRERASDVLTRDGWEEVRSLNLDAAAQLVLRMAPPMRGRGGDVVLIASVSGAFPDHAGPAYAASKAGLVAFGRGVARDFHGDGVRVTSILPGIVDTPLLDKRPVAPPPAVRRWCMAPDDVASAVLCAVSLPPRAYISEMTILATRLQTIGGTQDATPVLPDGLEDVPADRLGELT